MNLTIFLYLKNKVTILISLLLVLFLSSCTITGTQSNNTNSKIKNVIVVIGDGMGAQQISLLNAYVKYSPNSIYTNRNRISHWESMANTGKLGLIYTDAIDSLVTDSAASATQFSSGQHSRPEMIGANAHGDSITTMLEIAQSVGKATGLISDTRITHATPAAFAAHQSNRSKESAIAQDLLTSQTDVLLSAGLGFWLPQGTTDKKTGVKSRRKDKLNLIKAAEASGYQFLSDRSELTSANESKLLGLFAGSRMLNGIEEKLTGASANRQIPTLLEMTQKAVSVLEKKPEGFFLMVEAGLIDWQAHDNDTGAMLHEMIKMDGVLGYLQKWAEQRQDTLIIVTADHETGGFGFSYSRHNLPKPLVLKGDLFKDTLHQEAFNYGQYAILDKLYQQTASYQMIFDQFDQLPAPLKIANELQRLVNQHTQFPITKTEAERILLREKNTFFVPGHKYLSATTFPLINESEEFFVYGNETRANILASIVGKSQNTVWSTGTHTNTPVPLIAWGPQQATNGFSKFMHTTDWANLVISLINDSQ